MGSMWGRCRVDVGSMWGRCGVDVGSMWGQCGVDVGSMRVRCKIDYYLRRRMLSSPAFTNFLYKRDLQSFFLHFAVHLLCQHAEKDSLELVFKCLTSYRFSEERISSERFGI